MLLRTSKLLKNDWLFVDLSAARIPPGLGWNVNHGDRDDDDDGDDDDGDDDDDDDIPPN